MFLLLDGRLAYVALVKYLYQPFERILYESRAQRIRINHLMKEPCADTIHEEIKFA